MLGNPLKKGLEHYKFSHIDQGKYSLQIKSVNEDGYEKVLPKK